MYCRLCGEIKLRLVRLLHPAGHEVFVCRDCFNMPIEVLAPLEIREEQLEGTVH
jgi:hypothetical protein